MRCQAATGARHRRKASAYACTSLLPPLVPDVSISSTDSYTLIGGHPALDFCNTIGYRQPVPKNEHLDSYEALARWGERAGVLEAGTAVRLHAAAQATPASAERVLEQALTLRETLFRLFDAAAHGRALPPDDLATLDHLWHEALQHQVLVAREGAGAERVWRSDGLDRVLWPVVVEAADLLVAGSFSRLKQCDAEHCDWLFIDTSKNGRRRWCSMAECGNRAKARRFVRRRKTEAAKG